MKQRADIRLRNISKKAKDLPKTKKQKMFRKLMKICIKNGLAGEAQQVSNIFGKNLTKDIIRKLVHVCLKRNWRTD